MPRPRGRLSRFQGNAVFLILTRERLTCIIDIAQPLHRHLALPEGRQPRGQPSPRVHGQRSEQGTIAALLDSVEKPGTRAQHGSGACPCLQAA